MSNNEQLATPEPPFWYIVLIAEEFHLSLDEARTCAKREMEQERQEDNESMEVKS